MRIAIACLMTVGLFASNCNAAPAPVVAQQPTLKVGDPAPKFVVDKWIKGEPVAELAKGTVYVLDFWGTWCGPCVEMIPHMTSLQKQFKDKKVVVIGVSIWEADPAAVEPFVKKMGGQMDYRVATDRVHPGSDPESGVMSQTWMGAAQQTGVPYVFIVDREGKIAWTGHPGYLDRPLAEIADGKFDPKKEAELAAKRDALETQFGEAMQKSDLDGALSTINQVIALDPSIVAIYRPAKIRVLLQKKDYKGATAEAKEALAADKTQRSLFNLAMLLVNQAETSKDIDVDVALKLAEKGVAMGGDLGKAGKSVVAMTYAAKGDYAKAVEHQTAAMEGVEGDQREILQRDLDAYKSKAAGK